jgi:hypothetical protein
VSGFLKTLARMADEIEVQRSEGIEHYLILDAVVYDLRQLVDGRTSLLAGENVQRESKPVNEPTGPVEHRPWAQIPAQWFVQAPNGAWFEVLGTRLLDGRQSVALRIGESWKSFMYDRAAEVPCRAGTLSVPWETLRDGLGAEILEDKA